MQIRIPKEDCYYISSQTMFGPFHDSGEPFDVIDTGDDYSSFKQGNSLHGQNSVSHSKSKGELTINSLISSSDVRPFTGGWTQGTHQVTFNGTTWYPCFPATISGGTHVATNKGLSGRFNEVVKYGIIGDTAFYAGAALSSSARYPTDAVITCNLYQVRPRELVDGSISSATVQTRGGSAPVYRVRVESYDDLISKISAYTPDIQPSYMTGTWGNVSKYHSRLRYQANVDKALTWFHKISNSHELEAVALPVLQSYGDLVQAACENVNPNTINAIAFIKDFKDIKSLVPKLKELNRISTHAGNYLSVEYGVLPTIDDLKTIWESFRTKYFYDPNGFQRASAYDTAATTEFREVDGVLVTSTHTVDRRIHLAINTSDTGLDALTERIRKLGLFPSLTNLWDLVPYSFVLDWFVDVGAVLERIDTRHQLLNLDIKYVIASQKVSSSTSLVSTKEGLHAQFDVSSYSRDVGTNVPQPKIFKENRVTAQKHWVEGSALILARKH